MFKRKLFKIPKKKKIKDLVLESSESKTLRENHGNIATSLQIVKDFLRKVFSFGKHITFLEDEFEMNHIFGEENSYISIKIFCRCIISAELARRGSSIWCFNRYPLIPEISVSLTSQHTKLKYLKVTYF